jgi:molybdopterin converting factor small subunit
MEARLADWAWDPARRSFAARMMVSRNLSADLRDETTCLADGDEILVLLPLAGG